MIEQCRARIAIYFCCANPQGFRIEFALLFACGSRSIENFRAIIWLSLGSFDCKQRGVCSPFRLMTWQTRRCCAFFSYFSSFYCSRRLLTFHQRDTRLGGRSDAAVARRTISATTCFDTFRAVSSQTICPLLSNECSSSLELWCRKVRFNTKGEFLSAIDALAL